jgi:hypothetical protein
VDSFLKTHAGVAGCRGAPYYEINPNESGLDEKMCRKESEGKTLPSADFLKEDLNSQSVSGSLYERETDRLLDGLGPRFIDWWMHKPLPVDADLLPEVVPGFRPPFRLCPPHARAKLTNDELTYLRKLAHPLPTHFVLGITLLTVICQFFPENMIFRKYIILQYNIYIKKELEKFGMFSSVILGYLGLCLDE